MKKKAQDKKIPNLEINNTSSSVDKKKQDINDFLETYEKIVDDLIGELSTTYEQPKYAVEWIKRVKKKISFIFFFFWL